MDKEMQSADVQRKGDAARRWANYMRGDERVSTRWRHLLVSGTDVKNAKGFLGDAQGAGRRVVVGTEAPSTFLGARLRVLREAVRAFTVQGTTHEALARGLLATNGTTPDSWTSAVLEQAAKTPQTGS